MSEANVPSSPDFNYSNYNMDDLAQVEGSGTQPASTDAQGNGGDWATVPLPGTLPLESIPSAPASQSESAREAELLALIRDLNRCNEVLLARITYLEEALETSQQALQQEVERSQQGVQDGPVAAAKQQSVAQLLSELEEANAGWKRQSILAETLQAQLETYQERSKHLERECALLRKQHTEKVQQAQTLESSCRDLRSRLQRQQRYTLQFKAALEKSLDVSTARRVPAAETPRYEEETYATAAENQPLAMPRADRIQPWSSQDSTPQADSQLLSLVRSLKEPEFPTGDTTSTPANAAMAEPQPQLTVDQDAEQKLWQDVERVIENSTPVTVAPSQAESASLHATPTESDAQFTEPMPWGPVQKTSPVTEPVNESESPKADATVPQHPTLEATTLSQLADIIDVSHIVEKQSETAQSPLKLEMPPLINQKVTNEVPPQTSPSPVVHPHRSPQKKRKSLSAVELPSFPPLPKKAN
ncbi:MAG: hypothetical protein AAGH78_12825 [Cyanobacteria bacterium P01_H01_bin.58]